MLSSLKNINFIDMVWLILKAFERYSGVIVRKMYVKYIILIQLLFIEYRRFAVVHLKAFVARRVGES